MTLTSSGHLVTGSTTSAGEFISGSFTMSGALLIGASEPPASYIYPIISYNEENEMFQVVNTEKSHPVQVRSLTTGELVESLTNPTFTIYVNGTLSEQTVTISAFNSTMLRYLVTVPAALAANPYDSVEINISDSVDGEGFAMINIVPPPSLIATAVWSGTEGAAVHTAVTSTLTLEAINAEVDTAISDAAIVSKIDTVDTVVDGIATTLATPDNFKADVSALATSAEITLLNNLSMSDIETACGSAITDAALPDAFLTTAIRSGRTVSQVLRIIEIMLDGSVTGLTSGSGSPVTFTGADGSTVTFTVDANGNRAISSVNLV